MFAVPRSYFAVSFASQAAPLDAHSCTSLMERWAANTLRTLGIILTANVVLVGSLFLVLLSMCAAGGGFGGAKHSEQVVPYLVGAGLVLVLGIFVIVRLARGIFRSMATGELAAAAVPGGILQP